MSDLVYPDIADAILSDILPLFGIGGPTWTRTRSSGDGITADKTTATASVGDLRAVPNAGSKLQQSAPAYSVYASDWLVMGDTDAGIQDQDVLTDGTYSFRITGAPETWAGYLIAPAEKI